VVDMDVAVRRGVRSGHHRPDARPHHGSVAHSGNRGRPAGQRGRAADTSLEGSVDGTSRSSSDPEWRVRADLNEPSLTAADRCYPLVRARRRHAPTLTTGARDTPLLRD
jgi:hypothetical protein